MKLGLGFWELGLRKDDLIGVKERNLNDVALGKVMDFVFGGKERG